MTLKFALTTLFIIISIGNLFSQVTQEWVRFYNGPGNNADGVSDLMVDDSGYIYVTGSCFIDSINTDIVTVKYDTQGNQKWVALFNGPGDTADEPFDLYVDKNFNVYVTGRCFGAGTVSDIIIIKYTSRGKLLWYQLYNNHFNDNDDGFQVAVDDSGNVFVGGNSHDEIITIKYNSEGNLCWVKTFNGPGNGFDNFSCLAVDIHGNVFVTGTCKINNYHDECVTIKYNLNGVQQWAKLFSSSVNDYDYSYCLALDNSGNIYITGEIMYPSFNSDCLTIKYDSAGNQSWVAIYNSPYNEPDLGTHILIDNSGNLIVGGQSLGTITANDYFALKYNNSGNLLWDFRHHEYFNDIVTDVVLDSSGNIYMAGTSQNSNTFFDFLTLKINSNGTLQWIKRYEGSTYFSEGISGLDIDKLNNIYVTGATGDIYWNLDITTIKYSQPIGIKPVLNEIPENFSLSQNYPNPFNPATKIRFSLPLPSKGGVQVVKVVVFDILGREISTLVNEHLQPGTYEVEWDASNFSSGVYYYRITFGNYSETKKMVLIK